MEFARKTFALTDEWYGMTMDDIRDLEEKIKRELDVKVDLNHEPESTPAESIPSESSAAESSPAE